ncbi:MAG TPA: ComF family protein [Jatrophihabitans sp.]|nr:ComF family protein [Jatrophihabitans sp.]
MSALADALDLALPRRCVGCGAAGSAWCRSCLPIGLVLRICTDGFDTVSAAGYEGAVRAALLRYKERGRRDLGPPLAGLLGRAVSALLDGERAPPAGAVLIPVPSSARAAAARGGDHVLRLARLVGRSANLPVATPLRLGRSVADSAGLSAAQRAANLRGAFAAWAPRTGRAAVLVDDIVTTGATLREARHALAVAGWPVLGAAVVAATPPGGHGPRVDHPLARPRFAV